MRRLLLFCLLGASAAGVVGCRRLPQPPAPPPGPTPEAPAATAKARARAASAPSRSRPEAAPLTPLHPEAAPTTGALPAAPEAGRRRTEEPVRGAGLPSYPRTVMGREPYWRARARNY